MAWKVLRTALLSGLLASPAFAQTPIKVGVIAPFSGPLGILGAEISGAIEILPEGLRKALKIMTCDTGSSPDKAAQCANSLAQRDGVSAVVGPVLSSEDQAVRSLLAELKVLQISLASPATRGEMPSTYFRMREDPSELATYAATFIRQTLKPKRLTVVAHESFLSRGKSWKDILPDVELRQITVKAFADLRAATEQAAKDDSDVVYLAYNLPLERLIHFAQAIKGKKVVMSVPYRARLEIPGMPNLVMVGLGAPTSDSGKRFETRYLKRHGKLPSTAAPYYFFAAFEVLADVLIERKVRTAGEAADLIRKATFQTVLGALRFEPRSREARAALPIVVVEYRAGAKATILAQSTGGTGCNCAYTSCCKKGCGCPESCSGNCSASRTVESLDFMLATLKIGDGGCHERR